MRLQRTELRPVRENIVPMINVVFLLLIFFLITSTLTPRPDRPIVRPTVDPTDHDRDTATDPNYLFVHADGSLSYLGQKNDAVWAKLPLQNPSPIIIEADQDLPATTLVDVISRLEKLDLGPIQMVVAPQKVAPE